MDKLKKWLDNSGITYTPTTYGANFFNNHTLDLHFNGVNIGIDCDYYKAVNLEKKIEKYCNRYGYTIIQRGGYPGFHYMNIIRSDHAEQLRNYEFFSRQSVAACEKHIHFIYTFYGKTSPTLNEELAGIMEFYEDEYKAFLQAEERKTA